MTLTQINKAGLDEIALDHVFTIGASGSSAYTFQGEGLNGTVNNPTLYLTRGKTYRFENGSGGHPIRIQSTSGASGTAYNTGVTNNAGSGTVIVEVQHDAPDVLYYQCTSHAAMNGILYITGALADGGVTTAKLADDAVTAAKLADNAVVRANISDDAINADKITAGGVDTSALGSDSVTTVKILNANVTTDKLADNAVTSQKIANEAVTLAKLPHGTGSNDGKFLRANNGADPSFESLPASGLSNVVEDTTPQLGGTLDTNSANIKFPDSSGTGNNRLFFGSSDDLSIFHNGTVNAIQGANSSNIYIQGDDVALLNQAGNKTSIWCNSGGSVDLHHDNSKKLETTSTGVYVTGGIRLGSNAASNELDDYEEGTWTPAPENLSNTPSYYNLAGKYTKVGRLVTIWGFIQVGGTAPTFHNNASDLHIAGLPFANDATTGYVGGAGPVTFQSWNIFGSSYNNYGANGSVVCGTANSTRTLFQVNPHNNGGIRGTARRNCLESGGPIITWTMQYQTTA